MKHVAAIFLFLFTLIRFFPITCHAQSPDNRVIFISSYSGSFCDGVYDGDVKLMNDVFGEDGWEHLLFSSLDTTGLFTDNTCLIFIDGRCDFEAFQIFYQEYRAVIENYVYNGGNLYVNLLPNELFYLGFDSISTTYATGGTPWGFKKTDGSVFHGPKYNIEYPVIAYFGGFGPALGSGNFSGNNYDIFLEADSIYELVYPHREILIGKEFGNGQCIFSNFIISDWESLFENYRNLRRNILYSLSSCVHGEADIGPVYVAQPQPACNLSASENLSLLIYNYGTAPQSAYTASYRLDDGDIITETFSVPIQPQYNDTITFSVPADFSACGMHTVQAWTSLAGDTLPANDTLVFTLETICAPLSSSGIPDTVCIASAPFYAQPEKGDGVFSGIGIVDADSGLFDPAAVGENNATEISYTYSMPIDYAFSAFDFFQPDMSGAEEIFLSDADYEKTPLGFTFNYFDNSYDSVFVSSSGYLSFGTGYTAYLFTLPDVYFNNIIALAGADLNPAAAGHVYVLRSGTAPNRTFTIRYEDVPEYFTSAQPVDVSAILYESSGIIELFTNHLPAVDIFGFRQGISNADGTIGYNTKNPYNYSWGSTGWFDETDSLAFRYTPALCERTITDTVFVTGDFSENILGNDTTFCPGGTQLLTANAAGTNYLWSSGDTTQSISISEGGTYFVQLQYDVNGSCLMFDTIGVTTAEQDIFENVLGNDTTMCWGDTVMLTAAYEEEILSQQWSTADTSDTIPVTESGLYAIVIEYRSGCSLYDSVSVTESDSLVLTFSVTNSPDNGPHGAATVYITGGTAPYTITWSGGYTTETLTGAYPGTYTVHVSDANNCTATDTVLIGIGTEIETNEEQVFTVFPNPAEDVLHIYTQNASSYNTLVLTTVNNTICFSMHNIPQHLVLQTAGLAAGMYFLHYSSDTSNATRKIVVQK